MVVVGSMVVAGSRCGGWIQVWWCFLYCGLVSDVAVPAAWVSDVVVLAAWVSDVAVPTAWVINVVVPAAQDVGPGYL